MATALVFDTLAYAKKLESVGFTDKQAEVQAEALAAMVNENLATKYDIELLKRDIIIKLGSMIAASVGILGTMIVIFHK